VHIVTFDERGPGTSSECDVCCQSCQCGPSTLPVRVGPGCPIPFRSGLVIKGCAVVADVRRTWMTRKVNPRSVSLTAGDARPPLVMTLGPGRLLHIRQPENPRLDSATSMWRLPSLGRGDFPPDPFRRWLGKSSAGGGDESLTRPASREVHKMPPSRPASCMRSDRPLASQRGDPGPAEHPEESPPQVSECAMAPPSRRHLDLRRRATSPVGPGPGSSPRPEHHRGYGLVL